MSFVVLLHALKSVQILVVLLVKFPSAAHLLHKDQIQLSKLRSTHTLLYNVVCGVSTGKEGEV